MRCPLLPLLLLHLALLTAGGDQEGGVCTRDTCDEAGLELDWETEQFPAQLRSWLAQERSTNQLVFCRHEADTRPTRATAVPLYRCGPSKYFRTFQIFLPPL